jgi:death-on-curing protein
LLNDPKWLTAQDLTELNEGLVPNHLVLDVNRVENAIAAPQQLFVYGAADEVDLVILAVRLLESVARGHAFEDGNKRTAWLAAGSFLQINGCVFAPPDTEKTAKWVEQLVTRELPLDDVVKLLRPFIVMPDV